MLFSDGSSSIAWIHARWFKRPARESEPGVFFFGRRLAERVGHSIALHHVLVNQPLTKCPFGTVYCVSCTNVARRGGSPAGAQVLSRRAARSSRVPAWENL